MKTKLFRILAMAMCAILMLTSVAFATDLIGLAGKAQNFVGDLFAIIVTIGVLIAAAMMVIKKNIMQAIIIIVLGLGVAYFIGSPDKLIAIINNTIGGIV